MLNVLHLSGRSPFNPVAHHSAANDAKHGRSCFAIAAAHRVAYCTTCNSPHEGTCARFWLLYSKLFSGTHFAGNANLLNDGGC